MASIPVASAGRHLEKPSGMHPRSERRTNTPRVLVIVKDLLVAEVLVSAMLQNGFLARTAVPSSTCHLEDLIAWKPDLALFDLDLIDKRSASIEIMDAIHRGGVALALLGRETEVERSLDDPMCAEAVAVVDKNSPLDDLFGTLCRVFRSGSVSEIRVRRSVSGRPEGQPRSSTSRPTPLSVLTVREREILAELMEGHRAETTAANGAVSISTVRSQIKSILQKLGVNSQLAAVAIAQQVGWAEVRADESG